MSLESIRQNLLLSRSNLDQALSEIDLLITPPVLSYDVQDGDNLESLIANGTVGTIYKIPSTFQSGAITISKPCTLTQAGVQLTGRATPTDVLPTINGQIFIEAPDVRLTRIKVQGVTPSHNLVMVHEPNLWLDRVVLKGSSNGQKRGVYAIAPNLTVTQSWLGGFWYSDDSQAILSERGLNGALIDDCYLEASGENLMLGGGDALTPEGIPQNIVIKNSHFSKPEVWRTQAGTGNKNLFELKMARNVKVDNCLFENSWVDAQVGYGIVLSVRNQYGRDPWATIEDVEFTNCTLRHVAGGISILGRDDLHVSGVMKNVSFKNFTIEDLSKSLYGTNGRTLQLQGGPENLSFEDFKVVNSNVHSAIEFGQPIHPFKGLSFRNVEFYEGNYGVQHMGNGFPEGTVQPLRGAQTLAYFNPNGYVWENVTIHKGPNKWTYPANTIIV
jgi:hypothetical protein